MRPRPVLNGNEEETGTVSLAEAVPEMATVDAWILAWRRITRTTSRSAFQTIVTRRSISTMLVTLERRERCLALSIGGQR